MEAVESYNGHNKENGLIWHISGGQSLFWLFRVNVLMKQCHIQITIYK